ncbi:hypothetical protein MJD09_28070 [bacterium]|nr:hypothetical protein [bacterium]
MLLRTKFGQTILVIGILVGVALALYATKPDQDHFRNWLNRQLQKPSGNPLQTAVKRIVQRQANAGITYQDKFLFAFAKTKAGGREWTFVGVFGTWVPL